MYAEQPQADQREATAATPPIATAFLGVTAIAVLGLNISFWLVRRPAAA